MFFCKKSRNFSVGSTIKKDISKWTNYYQVYTENGRQQSGLDAFDWAILAENYGVGELLMTSIDTEGTQKGFENDLIEKLSKKISIPFIVGGGFGKKEDAKSIIQSTNCNAISIASSLHYNKITISEIKNYLKNNNIDIIEHDQT